MSQQLPQETWEYLFSSDVTDASYIAEYLTVYQMLSGFYQNEQALSTNLDAFFTQEELQQIMQEIKKIQPNELQTLYQYNLQIWNNISDTSVFPVGTVRNQPEATVSFVDSWNAKRTYGGDRRHEGTDIMATVNTRGIYPIYNVAQGTVEKMGWLPQGGYRVGVRSENGVYFYYAHLAEYGDIAEGDTITGGEFLGMMGDTGYSEVEGTTGNFPVHLHFGIYLNDENGAEFAVNSYPFLQYLLWRTSR